MVSVPGPRGHAHRLGDRVDAGAGAAELEAARYEEVIGQVYIGVNLELGKGDGVLQFEGADVAGWRFVARVGAPHAALVAGELVGDRAGGRTGLGR